MKRKGRLSRIIATLIVLTMLQGTIQIMQSQASFIDGLKDFVTSTVMAEGENTEDVIFTTGVDISKNSDGSVIAKLSKRERTLTISGTGEMKNFGELR